MPKEHSSSAASYDWVKILLWAGFLISASVTAFLAFREDAAPPAAPQATTPATEEATPAGSPQGVPTLEEDQAFQDRSNRPEPVKLDMDEPVVVLITGIDKRSWENEEGPGLTDVIIVAVLDAQNKTAGLLSLPRDLWVEVPGFDYRKINQTYPLGEGYGYRGGGPQLLMETVGKLLDTNIDHYVQVDFKAFVTLVDAVDGVMVEVQERLVVDPDPSQEGNMKRLEPGLQVLPGGLALGYIRTRSTGEGDFGRTERQQQVLVALQKKIVNYEILPRLLRKAPFLYRELSSHIETNLTFGQITTLAWALKDVDPQNVMHRVIAPPMVEASFNNLGQYILVPHKKEIRDTWEAIVYQTAKIEAQPTSPPSREELIEQENAQITVLNGTTRAGLAGETADYLATQGLSISRIDNADKFTQSTMIYDYSGNPATIDLLLELMSLSESHLYHRAEGGDADDIVVILGSDWAAENSLP